MSEFRGSNVGSSHQTGSVSDDMVLPRVKAELPKLGEELQAKFNDRVGTELNWYRDQVYKIAKEEREQGGHSELKPDLDLNTSLSGRAGDLSKILSKMWSERLDALRKEFPTLLIDERRLGELVDGARKEGLEQEYNKFSFDKGISESERMRELSKIPEIALRKDEYRLDLFSKEFLDTTTKLMEASTMVGVYTSLSNHGDLESVSKHKGFQQERARLKLVLERLVADIPEDYPNRDKIISGLPNLNAELASYELAGMKRFNELTQEKQQEALGDYEKKRKEGGALFAVKEIFDRAGTGKEHFKEWLSLVTVGTGETVLGLINDGTHTRGAKYIEDERKYLNSTKEAGSMWGSDEKFSMMGNFSMAVGVSALGGLRHVSDAVLQPGLELANVGRIQLQRGAGRVGALLGDAAYGAEDSTQALSYTEYQEAEKTDAGLKIAKKSFEVAEIAASLALGKADTAGKLAGQMVMSGGMGAGSALSAQLMEMDDPNKNFDVGRFVDESVSNAAGSAVFSGFMRVLKGNSKILTSVVNKIEVVDGGADFGSSLGNFDNVNGVYSLAGALGGLAIATTDVADISIGDKIGEKVDGYLVNRKTLRQAQGRGGSKGGLGKLESEFEFKDSQKTVNTLSRVNVATENLIVDGREYEGYHSGNRKVFYVVSKNDIPELYSSILKSRGEVDPNGSYDVTSFIDKKTGLIFSQMPAPNETEDVTEARSANLAHEDEHREDLEAGREIDEERAYARASKYTDNTALTTYDESRYQDTKNLSLAASRKRIRVENSQLVRHYPPSDGIHTVGKSREDISKVLLFSDREVLRVIGTANESEAKLPSTVTSVQDLKNGNNKIVVDKDGNTIPVTQVMDEGSVRHIINQQNNSSCVSTAASMIVLDYIAEQQKPKTFWQKFLLPFFRAEKAERLDVDLRLLESVRSDSKTKMKNVSPQADKMLESFNASLKVLTSPAIDLTTTELQSLISNYGSITLSVEDEQLLGHEIVVDKIFNDPTLDCMVARIRDPFHGWMIDVEVSSLLKRLPLGTLVSVAFIVNENTRKEADQEVDYSRLHESALNSYEDLNGDLSRDFDKVKQRLRNRGQEPKDLSKFYSYMLSFIRSASWLEVNLSRLKDNIKYQPISSLEESMKMVDLWYEQINQEFEEYVRANSVSSILSEEEIIFLKASLNKAITLDGKTRLAKLISVIGNQENFNEEVTKELETLCRSRYQELSVRIKKALKDKPDTEIIRSELDIFIRLTCLFLQAKKVQFHLEAVDVHGMKVPYLIINSTGNSKLAGDAQRSILNNKQALIFEPYTQIIEDLNVTYEMLRKVPEGTQKILGFDLSNGSINLSLEDLIARADMRRGVGLEEYREFSRAVSLRAKCVDGFVRAKEIARGIRNGIADFQVGALRAIAENEAKVGLFVDAKETAGAIEHASFKASALRTIAENEARAGFFGDAKETAGAIEDANFRASALGAIAENQAKRGLLEEAKRTFIVAKETTKAIEDLYISKTLKVRALRAIAESEAKAGFSVDAKETAEAIEDAGFKAEILGAIAESEERAGLLEEAEQTFKDAKATVRAIQNEFYKAEVLGAIAECETRADFLEEAKKTFEDAKETLRAIDDEDWKASENERASAKALGLIAQSEAKAGLLEEAKKTFMDAKVTARAIEDLDDKFFALSSISGSEAKADFFVDAKETAREISNSLDKAMALAAIVDSESKAGLLGDALVTASSLDSAQPKARAIAIVIGSGSPLFSELKPISDVLETVLGSGVPRLIVESSYIYPAEIRSFLENQDGQIKRRESILAEIGVLCHSLSKSSVEEKASISNFINQKVSALKQECRDNREYYRLLSLVSEYLPVEYGEELILEEVENIREEIKNVLLGADIDNEIIVKKIRELERDQVRLLKPLVEGGSTDGRKIALKFIVEVQQESSPNEDGYLSPERARYLLEKQGMSGVLFLSPLTVSERAKFTKVGKKIFEELRIANDDFREKLLKRFISGISRYEEVAKRGEIEAERDILSGVLSICHDNTPLILEAVSNLGLSLREFENIFNSCKFNNSFTSIMTLLGEGSTGKFVKELIVSGQWNNLKGLIENLSDRHRRETPEYVGACLEILALRKEEVKTWSEVEWRDFGKAIEDYTANVFSILNVKLFSLYEERKADTGRLRELKEDLERELGSLDSNKFFGFSQEFITKYDFRSIDLVVLFGKYINIQGLTTKDYGGVIQSVGDELRPRSVAWQGEVDGALRERSIVAGSIVRKIYIGNLGPAEGTLGGLIDNKEGVRETFNKAYKRYREEQSQENEIMLKQAVLRLVAEVGEKPLEELRSGGHTADTIERYLVSWNTLLGDTFKQDAYGRLLEEIEKMQREEGSNAVGESIALKDLKITKPDSDIAKALAKYDGSEDGLAKIISEFKKKFNRVKAGSADNFKSWLILVLDDLTAKYQTRLIRDKVVLREGIDLRSLLETALLKVGEEQQYNNNQAISELILISSLFDKDRELINAELGNFKETEGDSGEELTVGFYDDLLHLSEFMLSAVCTWVSRPNQVQSTDNHFGTLVLKNEEGRFVAVSQVQLSKLGIKGGSGNKSAQGYGVLALPGLYFDTGSIRIGREDAFKAMLCHAQERARVLGMEGAVVPVSSAIHAQNSQDKAVIKKFREMGWLEEVILEGDIVLSGSEAHNYKYGTLKKNHEGQVLSDVVYLVKIPASEIKIVPEVRETSARALIGEGEVDDDF